MGAGWERVATEWSKPNGPLLLVDVAALIAGIECKRPLKFLVTLSV